MQAPKQIPFSIVPHEVHQDDRLTLRQLRVLIALFSFRNKNTDTVWPRRETLAAEVNMTVGRISTVTTELQGLGWLAKEGNGGRGKAAGYRLTVPDLPVRKSAETVPDLGTVPKSETVPESVTKTVPESVTKTVPESVTKTVPELGTHKIRTDQGTDQGTDNPPQPPEGGDADEAAPAGDPVQASLALDAGPQPATPSRFDEFWTAFPPNRKVDRKKAAAIWAKRKLDNMADRIIADLNGRKTGDQKWIDGFNPSPTTYLNGDRWEDVMAPLSASPIRHSLSRKQQQQQPLIEPGPCYREFIGHD